MGGLAPWFFRPECFEKILDVARILSEMLRMSTLTAALRTSGKMARTEADRTAREPLLQSS